MNDHTWFGGHYLGGERSRAGGRTFHARDPRSGADLPGTFSEATAEEIALAGERAAAAFERVTDVAPADTSRLLEGVADGLVERQDAIVARADAETALGRPRLEGELVRTTTQLRMFAGLVREGSWVDARIDRRAGADLRRMRVPLGPIAVFGASNFPLAFSVAGGDTASAWAAGCPVVVKAHPAHPGTSELVAEVVGEALAATNLPAAFFQMVQGSSHEVGRAVVMDPNIEAVGFTGSFRGGKALARAAAEREKPIPVFAEMGSVNPVLLLPEAVERRGGAISEALAGSITLGVGQFCTHPGLLVALASDALDSLLADLASRLEDVGEEAMLTQPICAAYEQGLERLVATDGVGRLTRNRATEGRAVPALFRTSASTFLTQPSLAEENFGPSTLVVACTDVEELLAVTRGIPGSLTATIHMHDEDGPLAARLLPRVARRVGRIIFNGLPTGVAVSPAMHHGGPYPASTDSRFTSVGTAAIERFVRPLCLQGAPEAFLPAVLRDDGPAAVRRQVDGEWESTDRVTAEVRRGRG